MPKTEVMTDPSKVIRNNSSDNEPLLKQLFDNTFYDNRIFHLRKYILTFSVEQEGPQTVTAHNRIQKAMA
jgi:hypothetical protein